VPQISSTYGEHDGGKFEGEQPVRAHVAPEEADGPDDQFADECDREKEDAEQLTLAAAKSEEED